MLAVGARATDQKVPIRIKKKEKCIPVAASATVGGASSKPSWARWSGEHLECSPCGDGAVPVLGLRLGDANALADPEVLLSLLPVTTRNYNRFR